MLKGKRNSGNSSSGFHLSSCNKSHKVDLHKICIFTIYHDIKSKERRSSYGLDLAVATVVPIDDDLHDERDAWYAWEA